MNIELLIQSGNKLFSPSVEDGITWTTERKGSPSVLKFTVMKDSVISFLEGDPVRFRVDDQDVFYGFVFTKKRSKDGKIQVTAYDQLRYFKNKDTYVFEGKTAGQIVDMIAKDFNLNTGKLTETKYVIPSLVESNATLFDMVQDALDLELQNAGEMFVLFDDFGKLTLKNISEMKLDLLIDSDTGENFDYQSSIDSDTFNQVKLIEEDQDTGKRSVYIAKDSSHINQWGVLQYTDNIKNGENGQVKADALLSLYNQKSRSLKVSNAFGDVRCRGGSLVIVKLNLGDILTNNYMLIEKAQHTFKDDQHSMTLNLIGGVINNA